MSNHLLFIRIVPLLAVVVGVLFIGGAGFQEPADREADHQREGIRREIILLGQSNPAVKNHHRGKRVVALAEVFGVDEPSRVDPILFLTVSWGVEEEVRVRRIQQSLKGIKVGEPFRREIALGDGLGTLDIEISPRGDGDWYGVFEHYRDPDQNKSNFMKLRMRLR